MARLLPRLHTFVKDSCDFDSSIPLVRLSSQVQKSNRGDSSDWLREVLTIPEVVSMHLPSCRQLVDQLIGVLSLHNFEKKLEDFPLKKKGCTQNA
jgi:hypothetical protein